MEQIRPHKQEAVIVDCDGTLVDTSSIVHLVLQRPKKYDHFHYASVFCPPHEWVVEEVRRHWYAGRRIIIVSARKEKWRDLTTHWLQDQRVPWDEMHLRGNLDDRKDVEVKRDIYNELAERYDIMEAFDDNPAIIALWNEVGVPVTVVPGWAG